MNTIETSMLYFDSANRMARHLGDTSLLALKNRLLLGQVLEPADIEGVTNSIRFVTRNLFPTLFERISLKGSLQALCDRMTNAGVFTTWDIVYDKLLSKNDELQLYCIIQETLTNIYKHAEAAKITIRISQQEIFVEIKDSGKSSRQIAEMLFISEKTIGAISLKLRLQPTPNALGSKACITKVNRILIQLSNPCYAALFPCSFHTTGKKKTD